MHRFLEDKLNDLQALCVKYRVKRLELFGSAASTDGFDPGTSDLDFLIEFLSMTPVEHANAYFDLLQDLQDLFERNIDLVELKAVDNPYFMESIDRTRRVVYAA